MLKWKQLNIPIEFWQINEARLRLWCVVSVLCNMTIPTRKMGITKACYICTEMLTCHSQKKSSTFRLGYSPKRQLCLPLWISGWIYPLLIFPSHSVAWIGTLLLRNTQMHQPYLAVQATITRETFQNQRDWSANPKQNIKPWCALLFDVGDASKQRLLYSSETVLGIALTLPVAQKNSELLFQVQCINWELKAQ